MKWLNSCHPPVWSHRYIPPTNFACNSSVCRWHFHICINWRFYPFLLHCRCCCSLNSESIPYIRELVSSAKIGHDLHVVYIQIWLANIFCLAEIHLQMNSCSKSVDLPKQYCLFIISKYFKFKCSFTCLNIWLYIYICPLKCKYKPKVKYLLTI